jgi:hypothetical protein
MNHVTLLKKILVILFVVGVVAFFSAGFIEIWRKGEERKRRAKQEAFFKELKKMVEADIKAKPSPILPEFDPALMQRKQGIDLHPGSLLPEFNPTFEPTPAAAPAGRR